jgi:U5 small nuclear ribonucleoprotein component
MGSAPAEAMTTCDRAGPLVLHVTKLFHTTDAQSFRAFGRIMSGVVRVGQKVKVLGEGYSPEDEEDMVKAVVDNVWIWQSRYTGSFNSEATER